MTDKYINVYHWRKHTIFYAYPKPISEKSLFGGIHYLSPEGGSCWIYSRVVGGGGGHRIQAPSDRGGHRIQTPSDRGGHRIRTPSYRGGHRIRADTLPLISDPPLVIINERPLTLCSLINLTKPMKHLWKRGDSFLRRFCDWQGVQLFRTPVDAPALTQWRAAHFEACHVSLWCKQILTCQSPLLSIKQTNDAAKCLLVSNRVQQGVS